MLLGVLMLPWLWVAALPGPPLKHTNLLQTILRAIPLCFNPLPGPR